MRILKANLEWFQSWQHLEFDYADLGLTLIAGRARAGKSTLLDAPCWILFGTTSKESAADDVRSWNSEGKVTVGELSLEDENGPVLVVRKRGSATQNDLYFVESIGGPEVRGKDMRETQKLLETRLGVTAELWVDSSYLHQFSNADTFFIAKPKDRRAAFEKVADVSTAVSLSTQVSEARKGVKKTVDRLELDNANVNGKIDQVTETLAELHKSSEEWEKTKVEVLEDLKAKSASFDADKAAKAKALVGQIELLDKQIVSEADLIARDTQATAQLRALGPLKIDHGNRVKKLAEVKANLKSSLGEFGRLTTMDDDGTCPTCLGPADNEHRSNRVIELESLCLDLDNQVIQQTDALAALEEALSVEDALHKAKDKTSSDRVVNQKKIDKVNTIRAELQVLRAQTDPHAQKAALHQAEANPYLEQIKKQQDALATLDEYAENLSTDGYEADLKLSRLNWLYDKSFFLRGMLLQSAVRSLNERTNVYLEKYFDADLRIRLTLKNDDELDVEINNKGYTCPYRQLSGSERRMLSFAFSIAFMLQAQNTLGKKMNLLLLDEPLNHMDSDLKVKAFSMLQSLEADMDTILLIDHCEELKQLVTNQFLITNDGTRSEITREP